MFGVSDPVDLITEGREKLAVEDRSGWSTAALGDRLMSVVAARERLDAELLRIAAEFDARGGWAEDGYASPAAWLVHNAPVAKPAAGHLVRAARHIHRFRATGDALADDVVTTEKVGLLAEAARHREEFYARDEQLLLESASRLDVREITAVTRTWQQLADDELADADAGAAFERLHLDVGNTLLGGVISGFLDPDGTVTLTRALDLLEPPDPVDGSHAPRSLSRRRGEGLVKLAQHYLERRGASVGGETRGRTAPMVHAVFTVPRDNGTGTGDLDERRSELEGFGPVPRSTIQRLMCDAKLGWVALDGRREVLAMGRAVRTPSAAQRRAVLIRDRHCGYPGCRAPAHWCDVHHVVEWANGGRTDVTNLVLLCRRHHVLVHEGRRHLVRDADGTVRVERHDPRARGPSG